MWDYDDIFDAPVFEIPETGPILTGDSGGGFGWPDTSNVFDVLGQVAAGVGSVAKTAWEFKDARETAKYNRQLSMSQQQLELMRAQGAIANERARIEQQGAIERLRAVPAAAVPAAAVSGIRRQIEVLAAPVGGTSNAMVLVLAGVAAWWALKK